MTEQQTSATDNALVEKLAFWAKDRIFMAKEANLATEAAERIKSLLAERDAWQRQAERTQDRAVAAEADRQRMRDALEVIERAPAWGYPDKWETTPAEVRQLAREALNPASKEANDGNG